MIISLSLYISSAFCITAPFSRYSSSSKSTPRPAPYSTNTLIPASVSCPTSLGVNATLFSNPPGFSGDSISLTKAIFLNAIDKQILASDLGINPTNDGKVIRLTIPQLNEERRRELVKLIKRIAEDGKVSIRNVRRDTNNDIKKIENKIISSFLSLWTLWFQMLVLVNRHL